MKKFRIIMVGLACIMTLAFQNCNGNNKKAETQSDEVTADSIQVQATTAPDVNPFPWDFPAEIKLNGVELGQYVLSPYTFYPLALEEGEKVDEANLIFYSTTMDSIGEGYSKVGRAKMPNALIIPLPKNQSVKKGDIVLTWWQSGSGIQRAIVTDASDPTQPKVNYLDLSYDMSQKYFGEQLKPNSFLKVEDGAWQPGAEVAAMDNGDWQHGIIINVANDKVLVYGFASKVKAYSKNNCKLIPVKPTYKKGDTVRADFVGSMRDGYVITKVDFANGFVWVKQGNGDAEARSILHASNVL